MEFTLTCEVSPAAAFGLPEDGTLVRPAPGGEFKGRTFHSAAGVPLGYGTLPRYRALDSRLEVDLKAGETSIRFRDNSLECSFIAQDSSVALETGLALVERLLRHLALEQGESFLAEPRVLEDESGTILPLPTVLFHGTVTVYDTEVLAQRVSSAASRIHMRDAALEKALEYYDHALFSARLVGRNASLFSETRVRHLAAAAFLCLWKAISTIVGDPSTDKDYQSRYRRLGLDYEFFSEAIESVRRRRNDDDVAHYRLDAEGLGRLDLQLGEARATAQTIIKSYADYLRDGENPSGSRRAAGRGDPRTDPDSNA